MLLSYPDLICTDEHPGITITQLQMFYVWGAQVVASAAGLSESSLAVTLP